MHDAEWREALNYDATGQTLFVDKSSLIGDPCTKGSDAPQIQNVSILLQKCLHCLLLNREIKKNSTVSWMAEHLRFKNDAPQNVQNVNV